MGVCGRRQFAGDGCLQAMGVCRVRLKKIITLHRRAANAYRSLRATGVCKRWEFAEDMSTRKAQKKIDVGPFRPTAVSPKSRFALRPFRPMAVSPKGRFALLWFSPGRKLQFRAKWPAALGCGLVFAFFEAKAKKATSKPNPNPNPYQTCSLR